MRILTSLDEIIETIRKTGDYREKHPEHAMNHGHSTFKLIRSSIMRCCNEEGITEDVLVPKRLALLAMEVIMAKKVIQPEDYKKHSATDEEVALLESLNKQYTVSPPPAPPPPAPAPAPATPPAQAAAQASPVSYAQREPQIIPPPLSPAGLARGISTQPPPPATAAALPPPPQLSPEAHAVEQIFRTCDTAADEIRPLLEFLARNPNGHGELFSDFAITLSQQFSIFKTAFERFNYDFSPKHLEDASAALDKIGKARREVLTIDNVGDKQKFLELDVLVQKLYITIKTTIFKSLVYKATTPIDEIIRDFSFGMGRCNDVLKYYIGELTRGPSDRINSAICFGIEFIFDQNVFLASREKAASLRQIPLFPFMPPMPMPPSPSTTPPPPEPQAPPTMSAGPISTMAPHAQRSPRMVGNQPPIR